MSGRFSGKETVEIFCESMGCLVALPIADEDRATAEAANDSLKKSLLCM